MNKNKLIKDNLKLPFTKWFKFIISERIFKEMDYMAIRDENIITQNALDLMNNNFPRKK